MKKYEIDARDLPHPEPLMQATKILRMLDNDAYLYMLHRKNPIPLVDLAEENGFLTLAREDSHGDWHILITKNRSVSLEGLLRV